MPEEINRIVTDRIADILLTPSRDGDDNLQREGVPAERIHFVGNIMIDTLFRHRDAAKLERIADRVKVKDGCYAVLTLHRPSNVDVRETFTSILSAVATIAAEIPVVFPVHPRTKARVKEFGLGDYLKAVQLMTPLGYIDFLSLTSHAKIVLTDSGGLQEESTALGIPCLTLRENTERPVTVTHGTNTVVGTAAANILAGYRAALRGDVPKRQPELWDGRTAERIRTVFQQFLFA
jgi:UDP-N-acetylglucosamine 2-epimerase (non-hydrolysing)